MVLFRSKLCHRDHVEAFQLALQGESLQPQTRNYIHIGVHISEIWEISRKQAPFVAGRKLYKETQESRPTDLIAASCVHAAVKKGGWG
jgi:hypothetical protein